MNEPEEGTRNRLLGNGRPQRLCLWTARLMTKVTDNVPYSQAREITPILARSPEHVIDLIWQAHKQLCVDQVSNVEKVSRGQRERMLMERFVIIKLTDEIWSNYDFISKYITTPL